MSRGIVLAVAIAIAASPRAAHAQPTPPPADGPIGPPVGAWFRYDFGEHLIDGTGAYEGWADATTARARYEITGISPEQVVSVHAVYTWRYRSPDRAETQSQDREVTFDLRTRRYTGLLTDSSDYDDEEAGALAAWMWIPPTAAVGDTIPLLDHDFVVRATDARIEVAGAERDAIELGANYQGRRDDEYGHFTTETTDRYWFDRATGMFLREEVSETDTGTLDGEPASFTMRTRIDVIDASYAPSPVPVPDDPPIEASPIPVYHTTHEGYGGSGSGPTYHRSHSFDRLICVAVPVLFAVIFLWILGRRGRARFGDRAPTMADGSPFSTSMVHDPRQLALPPAISPRYQPFLEHFARVAIASGNAVHVAQRPDGQTVGLAIGDRGAEVATIFAPDPDVCEQLRRAIGQSEFFSETRHGALTSVVRSGAHSPAHAYNVYETYEVLELTERPEDLGYDRDTVRRYAAADRDGAVALLDRAYGVPSGAWLDAAIGEGDLAWVAVDGEKIVGFAAASLCGDQAHLHALTVDPDARGRGLGTGLMRARLRALFDLGAKKIVSECATWNLAAREVASRHGLRKVGDMYVESSDVAREDRKFVRR